MTPIEELIDAAKAVVRRWDSPLWKWTGESSVHTATLVNQLRDAIEKAEGESQ